MPEGSAHKDDERPAATGGGSAQSPVCGTAYAALDLGTNNCRLLIARRARKGFRVIDAYSRIVRLGEGLACTGRLQDSAVRRTIEALEVCARRVRRHPRHRVRCVATEACRRAENCAAFIERVHDETGLTIEVISSGDEAALAVRGCESLMDRGARFAFVFDIGGGSTELIWQRRTGGEPRIVGTMSVPVGVVNFAERHGGDRFTAARYREMIEEVKQMIAPFDHTHGPSAEIAAGGVQMIGTSGTVTTLASVHLGQRRYDRRAVDGTRLSFDDVARVSARLAAMSFAERAAIATVGESRADLVVAGAAILQAICEQWPVGEISVADRGLREGIIMGLIEQDRSARSPDRPN